MEVLMQISGYEANLLLYALDNHIGTDSRGLVPVVGHNYCGLKAQEVQNLRDRLLAAHEHKEPE